MDFPENLKELRTRRGLSQKALADSVNVSQTAIYHWEKGERKPKGDQIISLANALDVSIEELMGYSTHSIDKESVNNLASLFSFLEEKTQNQGELSILRKYRKLNSIGKEEAIKRVSELTEIQKYTEKEKPQIAAVYKLPQDPD